jgi:hypothetical protein
MQARMTNEDDDHDNRHACVNVLHLLWNGATHQRHAITGPIFSCIYFHLPAPVSKPSTGQRVVTLYFLSVREPLLCCRAVVIVRSNVSNERSTVAQPTSKQVSVHVEEQRQSTSRLLTMKRCPELASGIENPMSARIACPLVVASYSKSRSWAGGRALHGSRAGFKLVIG